MGQQDLGAGTVPAEIEDTLVLSLRKPVDVGGVTYTELSLSEPTMAQLRKANKAGDAMDQLAALINLNAKVPMAAVDALSQRDLEACADFFGRFSS